MQETYRALRGTRDILPAEAERWQFVEHTARTLFARYGFREIRTPILESTGLFARSVGAATDIVRKEMYAFSVGTESIALRPEATASVARAVVEHALFREIAVGYPERYYYIGPMFRHERPQKGRQRQFHQIGGEVLGAAEPVVDAETIQMVEALLDALGVERRELLLNSVGDGACRPRFRDELRSWLAAHLDRLCADCRRRYEENPLRVFDCKEPADRELLQRAPRLTELLCTACDEHFTQVRRGLEALGVRHRVEPHLVRGLDYYQRTVFEVVAEGLGAQNALLGGGRYDGLVQELGGPELPGFGFSIGLERLVLLLDPRRVPSGGVDAALIAVGAEAWLAAQALAGRLRGAGVSCVAPTVERPLAAQLRRADRLRARHAVFVGETELAERSFTVKDLRTGAQERVEESALASRLRRGGSDEH